MKITLKRVIYLILILSIISIISLTGLIFTSCDSAKSGDTITPTNQTPDQTPAEDEPVAPPEFVPVDGIDYGGYNFRILGFDGAARGTWQATMISEIIAEEEIGEPIHDAVYRRNREVEALYNVAFGIVPVTYPNRGDFATKFTKAVLAGDDLFDAAFLLGDGLPATLNRNNMVFDLLTIPSLNFSKSWWDQNSVKSLSINGKLNAVMGDMNFYSALAPIVIFANKQIMQDYSIDNLYQLVREGKWTWDTLYDVAKTTTKDLNGDGKIDKNDQVGLFTQNVYLYAAINSAGELMTPKNNDDTPELAPNIDRVSAITSKVVTILKDASVAVVGDTITGFNNPYFDFIMPKFRDGEIMFLTQQLIISFELRSMDADFSILPLPKYDESQANYGAQVANAWATYTVIPATCTDTERTGNILEAMGYYSQKYIMPAYFDVTVTNKLMRDDDSLEMMDIIFGNRVFDLANLYNWGDVNGMLANITNSGKPDTFVSQFEKNEAKINNALQKVLDELE